MQSGEEQLGAGELASFDATMRARYILSLKHFGADALGAKFHELLKCVVDKTLASTADSLEFSDICSTVAAAAEKHMPTGGLLTADNTKLTFTDAIHFKRVLRQETAAIDNRSERYGGIPSIPGRPLKDEEVDRVFSFVKDIYDHGFSAPLMQYPRTPEKPTGASTALSPQSHLSQAKTPVIVLTKNPALAVRGGPSPIPLNMETASGGFGQADENTVPTTPPTRSLHDHVPAQSVPKSPTFTVTMTGQPKVNILLAAQKNRCKIQRSKLQAIPFNLSKPTVSPEKPIQHLSVQQLQDTSDFGRPLAWILGAAALPPQIVKACNDIDSVLELVKDKDPQSSMWFCKNFVMCEHPEEWEPNGCDCTFPRCPVCKRIMPGSPMPQDKANALELYFSCVFRPWRDYDLNLFGKPRDCTDQGGYVFANKWVRQTLDEISKKHGEFSVPVFNFLGTGWVKAVVKHVLMARTYRIYRLKLAADEQKTRGNTSSIMASTLAKRGINLEDIANAMGPPPSASTSKAPRHGR